MNEAIVTTLSGVQFTVRLVREGDRYGLCDGLTWVDDPCVEFYDRRQDPARFGPRGQFVSRYLVDTIMPGECGLALDGASADWTIDYATMSVVRAWLRQQLEVNR